MIESIHQAFSLWMLRICASGLVALAVVLSAIGIGRLLGEKVRRLAKAGTLAIIMACVAVYAILTNGYLDRREVIGPVREHPAVAEGDAFAVEIDAVLPVRDRPRGCVNSALTRRARSAHGLRGPGRTENPAECPELLLLALLQLPVFLLVLVRRIAPWGEVLPDGFAASPIASFGTRLSLVPDVSQFLYGQTPSNSCVFTWENAREGRVNGTPFNGRIELFRNGDAMVSVGGSVTYVPRTLPFAHDGFGQDEDWVRANFTRLQSFSPSRTNADDIISIGYADWVDAQIGIGLTNGLYKFTATFTEDPPETTLLTVGDYSVAVTNAGEYSFVMEKGREYEFRTEPYLDGIDYSMQDDLLVEGEAPMLMSWWGGSETPGEWSVDGGWHWLYYPDPLSPGWFGWMPTLRGSPDIDHIGPNDQGMIFEAILSDCSESLIPSFAWTASNDEVHFTSPNAQSTGLTSDSFPSWNSLTLTVQANLDGYSLWSSLHPTYGTNDTPQVHLALSVPKGVAVGGIRRKLTAAFDSDIETNGCVVLRCIKGIEGIEMWSAPSNGVSVASSNLWQVEKSDVFTCYLQGNAKSDFEGVEFEYQFVPEGGSRRGVTAKSTVFECYTQPINNTHYSGLHVINPSFLNPQSNAVFRVTVDPNNIPVSEIQWSENSGSAMFPGGNTGTEVEVLGISGMADLEIKVLGTTDERMHFKAKVEQ